MIKDRVEHIDRYAELDGLKGIDLNSFSKGKFEIDGERVFGIGLEYETKVESEGLWEAHRRYLDVHVILEGEEEVQVSQLGNTEPANEYQAEGDYQLFDAEKQDCVRLSKGDFLVLYPHEVHKTSVQVKDSVAVKKVVYKLELSHV